MSDATGKRALVLVDDLYQELEVWYPILRLREAGATVTVAGPEKRVYRGKTGYEVEAQEEVAHCSGEAFDAVIIPGGYAPDRLRRHEAVLRLVREADRGGKVVAAICHGPWVMISAGIMKGRRATAFFAIKDDLVNAGAIYLDAEVVLDRNLITSRTPDDLPAFLRAILSTLPGRRAP